MNTLRVQDMDIGYPKVLEYVMGRGVITAPRGMKTQEVVGAQIEIISGANAMPLSTERRVNPDIGIAEALQLISGRSFPDLMTRITKNFRQFMDGEVLSGAYGPRIRAQVPAVVDALKRDPDTRQAVLQIWDPMHDLLDDSRDRACTIGLQFLLRNDHLLLFTSMRSQDVFWGLAYDIFMFAELQATIAWALAVKPGRIIHRVTSLHAYERDWRQITEVIAHGQVRPVEERRGRGVNSDDIFRARQRAEDIIRGRTPDDATPHERWMADRMERYW